jgi:hypothetical protein
VEISVRTTSFSVRLEAWLADEVERVAKAEGVAVRQLIDAAIAEKISAMRTEEYFEERAARGDVRKALQALDRAGRRNPPMAGDELSEKSSRRRR